MLHKLNPDFTFEAYGLKVRLVNEEDTDFILSLRTNKELSKYLHATDNDRQKQIEWLQKYKLRESEGRDYYFIYFKNDKPIGVNRIYNIHEYYGTPGSWLCSPDNDPLDSMLTYFCAREIYYNVLQLDILIYDVRKANKQVWKMHKMLGAQQVGESDIDYYFVMNKENYQKKKESVLKMLNIKSNY